jgi:CBS domain-containing protein/KaiC/GvpD/RAD55 family RecA-like ATPase
LGSVLLKVKDVMVTEVVTADAELNVREAVERMNKCEIGCLIVMEKGSFVGILTERDVLKRVVVEARNPDETLVRDVMSKSLTVVGLEASLEEATFLMLEKRVKKLPVVKGKKLVGIITLTDIARIARAKGLKGLEDAEIQVNLTPRMQEVKIEEDISLVIELVNAGKGPALLVRVEGIIPEGFKLIKKPRLYRVEDRNLNMKGERLASLKTEEIRLVLRATTKGSFVLKPRIIYLDETGKYKHREPEPVEIQVSEVVLPGRITTGYGDLDNLLLGGIPKNYAVILTSPSCDEKDLLIKRFLEAGTKEGQITFYITTKVSEVRVLSERLPSNFHLFVCNPQADTMLKRLPNVFRLKGVENLTDISIALALAFRRLDDSPGGQRRACIEIVSDVLLQHHAVHSRRWLNGVIPELRLQGFTTLAVMDPEMHPSREVRAILGLFEGEINIYEKETEKGLKKFLKIKRMYNQKYLESELHLKREKLEQETSESEQK